MLHGTFVVSFVLLFSSDALAESYCADKRSDCPEKAAIAKWCTDDPWAVNLCPVSCGACGLGLPVSQENCEDKDVHCAHWASSGECHSNRESMLRKCPTSWGICTPECRKDNKLCPAWRDLKECTENPEFAMFTCASACGACRSVCKDKGEHCISWTKDGQCKSNPEYMAKWCPLSCGICAHAEGVSDFAYCKDFNITTCAERVEAKSCNTVEELTECPQSCGQCADICMDHNKLCPNYVEEGKCDPKHADHALMLRDCPSSCGLCHAFELDINNKPCIDEEHCDIWAREGACKANHVYMMASCPIACGMCHEEGHPNMEVAREIRNKDPSPIHRTPSTIKNEL